ncbi:alpha/beta hydrolase [Flavobacteriales bacterium 34_180_T64]|nr:alpha/beta hydrolase [Flavobacteriales bacterium 34_180_T64]
MTTYAQFRKEQQSFLSSDGTIKYIDRGQGEVLVLLHGVPTSGWLYRKMIEQLSQNYRVIVPDMLGFGSSDSPKGYNIYAPNEQAKRLIELMNSLQINNWNHVFHDAGGLWTWELLKLEPHRINNLIILNTIIYEEGFKPPIRFKKGFLAKCIMALYNNGITTKAMLKGLFNAGLTNANIISKTDLEGYKKPLLEGKTKAMYHFFSNTCNNLPDYSKVFENLSMQKLLIWGKDDSFLVYEKMKDKVPMNLNIKAENIHIIEAKHFIPEEKSNQIVNLIHDFIKA